MTKRFSLKALEEVAKNRPKGYIQDVISQGILEEGMVLLTDEKYNALVEKYKVLTTQSFDIQSISSEALITETGNAQIITENNNIIVTSFGDDPDLSGQITIVISTPTIFTTNNHGLQIDDIVIFNSGSLLPNGLDSGTTYYVLPTGLTNNTFVLSSSPNGFPIVTIGPQSDSHSVTFNNSSQTQTSITNATPTIFQKPDHGLQPGSLFIISTDGNLPVGLETGEIYIVLDEGLTTDSFNIGNLDGGSDGTPIVTTGTQSGNHSISVEGSSGGSWRVTNQNESSSMMNIRKTIQNIQRLKFLLYNNGSTLTVIDTDNQIVLEAVGGVLKSLSLDTGSNTWNQTIPFTAELEFSHINFFQETLACATHWDTTIYSGVVDMNKYPLKSFNDGWSIVIDAESFNHIQTSDGGNIITNALRISNNTIQVSYNISAVGKNYYRENRDPPEFKPAWEIAKHFVQERLFDQVTSLIGGIGKMSAETTCYEQRSLTTGILSPIQSTYDVYNETINCSFSELEGSFNATYNSILKKRTPIGTNFGSDAAKHTITKTISHDENNNSRLKTNISINGTIEGLIRGGLINSDKATFELPRNGSFLIRPTTIVSGKYDNAYNLWSIISSGDDISNSFKDYLGIKNSDIGLSDVCIYGNTMLYPLARSFTLTRNKIDGTIDYSISYNNECISSESGIKTVKNISVDFQDATPVVAEFLLPNIGTVLQDINTVTSKEISFTITGRDPIYKINNEYTTFPPSFIKLMGDLVIDPKEKLTNFPDYEQEGWTVKNRSNDINVLDGTYNMQLTYTCITGCIMV